jgi:GNAT superfamily N-acetyltransferase
MTASDFPAMLLLRDSRSLDPGLATLVMEAWQDLTRQDPRIGALYAGRPDQELQELPAAVAVARAAQSLDPRITAFVLRAMLDAHRIFLVDATAGRGHAGFLVASVERLAWGDAPYRFVQLVYVTPAWRRRRVASSLLQVAIEEFKQAGCESAWGEVMLRNRHAVEVWEHLGFESLFVTQRLSLHSLTGDSNSDE